MEKVDLSTFANLLNALAVTAGVIFAAVQIRHYRQQRRRDAMLELVRSFQSPPFARALHRVNSLPDGADRQTIRAVLGPEGEDDVFLVGLTWESLGVLAFRREVTLDLMADFFSGAIVIVAQTACFRRGRPWLSETRDGLGMVPVAGGTNDRTRKEIASQPGAHCTSRRAVVTRSTIAFLFALSSS